MIKLTKTEGTDWAGNGFGSRAAEWVVKGAEGIAIRSVSSGTWYAIEDGKRIASGSTRSELLGILESKRPHLSA